MQLADAAGNDVDMTNIQKTDMDSTPLTKPSFFSLICSCKQTHAEKGVEEAVDELVATGALQTGNRMDIESLFNQAGKSHVLMETRPFDEQEPTRTTEFKTGGVILIDDG